MLVLDTTSKTITVAMTGTPATTNPSFVTAYSDDNGTTFVEGSSDGQLNGTTQVTMVAAPAASTRRLIKSIFIENNDTAPVTIIVTLNNSGTLRNIQKMTLAVGDNWSIDGVFDTNGNAKTIGVSGISGYSGYSGLSGYSGINGASGYSGYSGYSGSGISGYSGASGISGYSGYSGTIGSTTGSGAVVLQTNPSITNPTVTNYVETLYAPSAGSAFTISLANGTIQEISLNANGTITLPSSVAGKSFTIIVTYSGSYSLTWSGGGTLKWAGGTTPTATSTSGKYDIFNFYQDGTNTYGSVFGLNY
jgi:hypothetical protein